QPPNNTTPTTMPHSPPAAAAATWLPRLLLVYATDWALIVATIAFAGSMSFWATPSARPFSLVDPSIAYPYQTHAKIPTALLVVLAGLIPALACVAVPLLLSPAAATLKRRVYAANKALLGLLLSIAMAMLLTDALKNLMGKPRPDMIARCAPAEELLAAAQTGWGLVSWEVCANLGDKRLADGFRSFPSGHASMSFAGLTYTSLFLASFIFSMQMPFARAITPFSGSAAAAAPSAHPKVPQMLSFAVVATPMLLATYVASTRWSDYRHHGFDVLFGSFEGIVCALVGWGWYGVF
ncbi:phosphatidic acid phosphatase type 2/haloperoxidase, partial [Morchella snyderi]